MTWHDTELFPFPEHDLTGMERTPNGMRVRDALVASLTGYRPLHIDVDIPDSDGPVPVVAWIHGGGWLWGAPKLADGPVPSKQIRERLLAEGIAFAALEYRLAAEESWPAPLLDLKAGIRWLRRYAAELNLDTSRIAVWGESAGAHLAALLATTGDLQELEGDIGALGQSSAVGACVGWYGPSDLASLLDKAAGEPVARLLGGDRSKASHASPVTYVSAHSAPILLIHGTDDSVVPYEQSEILAAAYRDHGAEAELQPVAGAGHAFAGTDPELYIEPSIRFLNQHFRRLS